MIEAGPVPLYFRNEKPESNVLIWVEVVEQYESRSWNLGGYDGDRRSWYVIGKMHDDGIRMISLDEKRTYLWEFAIGYWGYFKPRDVPPTPEKG